MMDFSGTETVSAPIRVVWTYLLDVQKVAACAPGLQGLEEIAAEHWRVLVSAGMGPIRIKIPMDVTRPEMHEPGHMVFKAQGQIPTSSVEVDARVHLVALGEERTRMDWSANLVVGGTLASIGTRTINSLAGKLTAEFFICLKEHLQSYRAS